MRLILLMTLAAAIGNAGAQAPRKLAVNVKPQLAIGVIEGDANYEFAHVSSAHRLSSGAIVVANGNPLEIRLFDAKGRFLKRIGRAGQGPQEFRGTLTIFPAAGDSILVYDAGNRRWSIYRPDGTFVREWPSDPDGAPMLGGVLYRRGYVRTVSKGMDACLRDAVDRLPLPPPPAFREIFRDGAGRYWVRQLGEAAWTLHAPDATPIGIATLPAGFALFEVGSDYVVGNAPFDNDVERIVVIRVSLPKVATPPPCTKAQPPAAVEPDRARGTELRSALRGAWAVGEQQQKTLGHWVKTADSLPPLKLPSDAAFYILRAGETGATLVIFDKRSTYFCAVGFGDAVPTGWPGGVPMCSN